MFDQLAENRSVEIATFVVFFLAGILGVRHVVSHARAGAPLWEVAFLGCVALGLLVLAGEEVAWGQWFFGWETPSWWDRFNRQDETTFHNMGPLQGNTEWLRLGFALAGLAGVLLYAGGWLRSILPSPALVPWFVVIAAFTIPDIVNDSRSFGGWVQDAVNKSSEAVELVISLASLAYVRQVSARAVSSARRPA